MNISVHVALLQNLLQILHANLFYIFLDLPCIAHYCQGYTISAWLTKTFDIMPIDALHGSTKHSSAVGTIVQGHWFFSPLTGLVRRGRNRRTEKFDNTAGEAVYSYRVCEPAFLAVLKKWMTLTLANNIAWSCQALIRTRELRLPLSPVCGNFKHCPFPPVLYNLIQVENKSTRIEC